MKELGFDLKTLEVFIVTAQTGNMTMAAKKLGLTQSSVSQTLANLERNLDTLLLDRSVRPAGLTIAGRYLYEQANNLIDKAKSVRQVVIQDKFEKIHSLKVAMVDSLASHLSTPLVKLIKHHSESWSISTELSHLAGESLIQRNVDIVISDTPTEQSEHNEYLTRFPIVKEPFLVVLPKSYQGKKPTLEQISEELDLIRYADDSHLGRTVEDYVNRSRLNAPTKVKLDNTQSVLSCVSAGLGWTITTPLCLLQNGIPREELTCLALPEHEGLYRELSLYSRQNELDNLPLCMSQNSQQIIRDKFLPKLEKELPWLSQ